MTPAKWIKDYRISKEVIRESPYYDEIKDYVPDENFVLINLKRDESLIELAVVDSDIKRDEKGDEYYVITHVLTGKKPQDIYFYLAENNLLKRNDHFAYVGKELQKAYDALIKGSEYTQL